MTRDPSGQRSFWSEELRHLPLDPPLFVEEETPIRRAVRKMQQRGMGCVLVRDAAGGLSGIVTTSDLMHDFVDSSLPPAAPVRSVMTSSPVTVGASATVADAAAVFKERGVRHLPVTAPDGSVLGLLRVQGLMTFMAEHLPEEVLNRPPEGNGVSEDLSGG